MAQHLQYNDTMALLKSMVFFIFLLTIALISSGCSGGALGGGIGDDDDDSSSAFEEGPVDIPITIAKATAPIDPSTIEFTEATESLPVPLLIKKQEAVGPGILSGCLYDRSEEKTICAYYGGSLRDTVTTTSGCFEFDGIDPPTERTLLVCSDADGDGTIDTGGPYITVQIRKNGDVTVVITNITMMANTQMAIGSSTEIYFCGTDADGNPAIGKISRPGEVAEKLANVSSCPDIKIKGVGLGGVYYFDTFAGKVYFCDSDACSEYDTTEDNYAYARDHSGNIAYATDADGKNVDVNASALTFSTDNSSIAYRVFDWKDSDTLLVGEALYPAGGTAYFEYDVSGQISSLNPPALTKAQIVPGSEFNHLQYAVSIDCDGNGNCYGLLDSGDPDLEINELVQIGPSVTILLTDRPVNTVKACPGGNPSFDIESGVSLGNQVAFYNISDGEFAFSSHLGDFPRCDPKNDNHTLFFCDEQSTGQICSFRPDLEKAVSGSPYILSLSGSSYVGVGGCISGTASTADAFGMMVDVTNDVTINLSTPSNNGTFYSSTDGSCSGSTITSRTISSGSHNASFDYQPDSAGFVYWHASDADSVLVRATYKILVE